MGIVSKVLEFFYPPRCPACGKLNGTGNVCTPCAQKLDECRPNGKVCLKCGLAENECDCRKFNFLFDGICAPFFNEGLAKDSVYGFKFGYRPFAAVYFGDEAARCFNARFKDAKPDLICFVPTHRSKLKKRDYDYVRLLAGSVSQKTGIPINNDGLKAVRANDSQHGMNLENRMKNVKGVYAANGDFKGKTVLLIDDIKTTGYTLSECAKQLKLAGAEKVFALSVNIDRKNTCKEVNSEL